MIPENWQFAFDIFLLHNDTFPAKLAEGKLGKLMRNRVKV